MNPVSLKHWGLHILNLRTAVSTAIALFLSIGRENLDQRIPNPCNYLGDMVLYLATCITVKSCQNKTQVAINQNYPLKEQLCLLCRFVVPLLFLPPQPVQALSQTHISSTCKQFPCMCVSTGHFSNCGGQIWGGAFESRAGELPSKQLRVTAWTRSVTSLSVFVSCAHSPGCFQV